MPRSKLHTLVVLSTADYMDYGHSYKRERERESPHVCPKLTIDTGNVGQTSYGSVLFGTPPSPRICVFLLASLSTPKMRGGSQKKDEPATRFMMRCVNLFLGFRQIWQTRSLCLAGCQAQSRPWQLQIHLEERTEGFLRSILVGPRL